jgi:2'-5' RNA ligase
MRLFVSIDLDGLGEEVAAVQQPLRGQGGLRPIDPEQAHVTLKFLGDVAEERVPAIVEALEAAVDEAGVAPFEAAFGGYGVFPSPEYIRVVWLGVTSGGEEMTALAEAVESRLTDIGFSPERHGFTPHVTLARMDHAGAKDRVQSLLAETPSADRLAVSEIRLTESTLTPDGPRYETVARVRL